MEFLSNVFFFIENSSEPNLLQEGSIADNIFSLQNCEISFEAFPTRQIVCWIKSNASVAGTAMSGLSFCPVSRRSRQAAVKWPQACQDCCLDLCQLCFAIFGELFSQVFSHVLVDLRYCAYLCIWSWVLLEQSLSFFLGQTSPQVLREVCLH